MEYNGTIYVMVRQFNGEYYMVPKQHASKFNKRTKLVMETTLLSSSPADQAEKARIASKIIQVNRSIPKSVVAFPVEQFNRMVCKHQIPALKLASFD
jgi:hypothetical protein